MREHQQPAREVGHRARDVQQQDDAARHPAPLAAHAHERLAARPERAPERPPDVERAGPGRPAPPRVAQRHVHGHRRHQLRQLRQLLRRAAGEALPAQELDRARPRDRDAVLLGFPGALAAVAGRIHRLRRPRPELGRAGSRVPEELPEDAVVHVPVVASRDQRRPAGPVQVGRLDQGRRAAERLDPRGPDRQARVTKSAAEADEPVERLSHPPSRRAPPARARDPRGS